MTVTLSVLQQGAFITTAKRRTITIGAKAVTLAAGQKRAILVTLNRAGKRLLASHGRLPALVKVSCGGVLIKTQRVQITSRRHK